jgi:hypothetical protein
MLEGNLWKLLILFPQILQRVLDVITRKINAVGCLSNGIKLSFIVTVKVLSIRQLPDDWNEKSKVRKLLNDEQYYHILGELQKLPKEINQQINLTNKKLTI